MAKRKIKRCGKALKVQSILFPKSHSIAEARTWLRAHGKKAGKVDVTSEHLRFRQMSPGSCKRSNYATIPFGRRGIKAVVCCPK